MRRPDPASPQVKFADGKSSFVATIASFFFFAGGQLYNGDFKKAGAIWLAYIVCAGISTTGLGAVPAFLLSLVVWAWAIYDAYSVAKGEKGMW
jgi:hypothetical protein